MILNILLILIIIILFYRICFIKESYQNPFMYSTEYIDKNKLTYVPMPYITPGLSSQKQTELISDFFIDKNNQLLTDLADNSNYIINDPSVKNIKILSFADKQLLNNNKCLDIASNSNVAKIIDCNSSTDTQKWSLINNNIRNMSNSKCLGFVDEGLVTLLTCDTSSKKQSWVPDTTNRLHNLNDYTKCLEVGTDNYLKLSVCNDSNNQTWNNN
jgi:hypothetical protein